MLPQDRTAAAGRVDLLAGWGSGIVVNVRSNWSLRQHRVSTMMDADEMIWKTKEVAVDVVGS